METSSSSVPVSDRDFLIALDRQLADAVTFLPPAMRASFHAQMGALIKLVQVIEVCDSVVRARPGSPPGSPMVIDQVEASFMRTRDALNDWRAERQRIAERTK